MSKITSLLNNKFTYSIEVTPDFNYEESHEGLKPIFYSITWHAKTHMCRDLNITPLQLAYRLRENGENVLLHLTCDLLRKPFLNSLLKQLQKKQLCNLFILTGEGFNLKDSDFIDSDHLIKYIRGVYRDYFCIGVSGYPQNIDGLKKLEQKIDSGADFIITQAIFEGQIIVDFVKKCRQAEIHVPIIPGIFAYQTNNELLKFTELCKVKIPESLSIQLKTDCNGFKESKNIINHILDSENNPKNIHFFSLNKCCNIRQILSLMSQIE